MGFGWVFEIQSFCVGSIGGYKEYGSVFFLINKKKTIFGLHFLVASWQCSSHKFVEVNLVFTVKSYHFFSCIFSATK